MAEQDSPLVTHRIATIVLLAMLGALLLGSIAAFPRIEGAFMARSQEDGRSTLRLVSDAVDQAIGRYAPMPGLIAGDPVLRNLLSDSDNDGLVPFVNEKLRQIALSVDASEIYVLDPNGTTIASSNYREAASFMGRNFDYRPYFQRAIKGQAARFHALGTTSGKRGFFFSAPILDGITVLGVLAIKVSVETFEQAWDGAPFDIIVADENGVAFLSNVAGYRLHALAPLTSGTLDRIAATRQFPLDTVTPIPFSASLVGQDAVQVTLGAAGSEVQYLSESAPLTLPGWHAIVLNPLEPIRRDAMQTTALWNMAALALGLALLVLIQGRARTQERIRITQTQNDLLEVRVKERTSDLDAANASLRDEITVRRDTEDRLRKTQKDLVQAGKLAALGQMSAALSHEINQPLAAVKSYAENARTYLQRDRVEEAEANIVRISEMTDRMAKISGHLRNFARQPGDTLKPIPIHDTIREAIGLVDPKLRQSGTELRFAPTTPEVWALGGRLRLQQVLVNIMTNAIDAMDRSTPKIVTLMVVATETQVRIEIRDRGPGLPQGPSEQVFEAFFTTKEAGSGMGLGLSISSNIIEDFGGGLVAANHPEGGALFTVTLLAAEGTPRDLVAE